MRKFKHTCFLHIVYGLLSLIFLSFFSCSKNKDKEKEAAMMQNQPKPYAVITVEPTRIELKSSYPATIRGKQDIEIRPNVSGFITQLLVDEGSVVKKGQILFKIDPVQYQAAVLSAEANVNVVQSQVQTSLLTLNNKRDLYQKNIISQFELQTAENDYASQLATLNQAEAQLLNARNNLSYTNVTSPSDGVVGNIPYRIGSLVGPSMTTPLTTVSDISEVFVYFSLTEKQLLELTKQNQSLQQLVDRMPYVELQLADTTLYRQRGKIETVSGVIDSSTGSVSLRATFPNQRNILRSGGTGVILIPNTIDPAIVIPQNATYDIQDKKFVYLVTDSSTVKSTEITVLNQDDGHNYVVTNGLRKGDRLVVEGVINLRDGTPIQPVTPEQSAAIRQQMSQPADSVKPSAIPGNHTNNGK